MSGPFQDAPTSPSDGEKQRKFDEYKPAKLSWFVNDDPNAEGWPTVESPTKATKASKGAKAPKRSRKLTSEEEAEVETEAKQPKSSKGKTPVKSGTAVAQTPIRQSNRIVGRKRNAEDSSSSDNDTESVSPLAQKRKTLKISKALGVSDVPAETLNSIVDNTESSPEPVRKKLAPVAPSEAVSGGVGKIKIKPSVKPNREKLTPISKQTTTPTPVVSAPSKKRAKTTEPDADNSDFDEAPPAKRKKKDAELEDKFKKFEAEASTNGMGSSTQAPDCAELDEPWKCANRMCTTGQTWMARGDDSKKVSGYGRKACSHWFGRNKRATNLIPADVWHYFCRKCYQRQGYQAKSTKSKTATRSDASVKAHVENVRNQIVRLQLWRPEMTFKVALLKQADQRLGEYRKALLTPGMSATEAENAGAFVPGTTSRGREKPVPNEYKFPIASIRELDEKMCDTKPKTFADLYAICDWIDNLNEAGNAPCDPPIEFLPSEKAPNEDVNDPVGPPDNYDLWAQYCDAQVPDSEGSEDGDAGESDEDADGMKAAGVAPVDNEADDADDAEAAGVGPVDDEADDTDSDGEGTSFEDAKRTDAIARSRGIYAGPGLYVTAKGLKYGLTGKKGIVKSSAFRSEMEAEKRRKAELEREAEQEAIKREE